MVIFIPIGLFTACLRSGAERNPQEQQYTYVQQPQQIIIRQQQYYTGQHQPLHVQPCSAPVTVQYGGAVPPPPYCASTPATIPQRQQQYQQYRPQQPQAPPPSQQQSNPKADSRPSQRRKPWQRRSKDGYAYTVLES